MPQVIVKRAKWKLTIHPKNRQTVSGIYTWEEVMEKWNAAHQSQIPFTYELEHLND